LLFRFECCHGSTRLLIFCWRLEKFSSNRSSEGLSGSGAVSKETIKVDCRLRLFSAAPYKFFEIAGVMFNYRRHFFLTSIVVGCFL
jgi:hypothetical protein